MTDMTAFVQKPGLVGVAPTYTQCTAADKFKAAPGQKYVLHYKNGATLTGILKVTDQATPIPAGSTSVAGFADAQVAASIAASGEATAFIDNSTRFLDSSGFINFAHATPTTLTLQIVGPL